MVNQELNFHTQDDNLVIKGGCDLFTTKPIGSDRKLFKTIDKHLDQIIEDNQLLRLMERERQNSINSLFGTSALPPLNGGFNHRRGSYTTERERRLSNNVVFNKGFVNIEEFKESGLFKEPEFKRPEFKQPESRQPEFKHPEPRQPEYKNEDKDKYTLEHKYEPTSDESEVDESPFGPLKNATTRKTFAYLIAILNSTYPDHDFLNLQPTTENFHRIPDAEDLINKFNNLLISLGKKETTLNWIWDTMNVYMDILPSKTSSPSLGAQPTSRKNSIGGSLPRNSGEVPSAVFDNCQIYLFEPLDESILDDLNYPYQTMWLYYWFIYNKKKKRVSFIYLTAINKIHYSLVNQNNGGVDRNDSSKVINGEDEEEQDGYLAEYLDENAVDDDDDGDIVGDLEI